MAKTETQILVKQVVFRRGRAKELVRSGFKEKILKNEAVVRQNTWHEQVNEMGRRWNKMLHRTSAQEEE